MLEFGDIAPRSEQVRIGGEDYLLMEATADAVRRWRNSQLREAKLHDGKISALGDIADSEVMLVSLCLRRNDKPVPVETLRGWPNRVIGPLFERIKEMSELDRKRPTEASTGEASSSSG